VDDKYVAAHDANDNSDMLGMITLLLVTMLLIIVTRWG
jgi:hypothetical protein